MEVTQETLRIKNRLLGSLEIHSLVRVTCFLWKYKSVNVPGLLGQPESFKLRIIACTLTDSPPCITQTVYTADSLIKV
ncbi:hypothetical protein DPMN_117446 [Dreissena polymorpha]|uniref:Uncharacterized protein n=1 Tax=Dreissena polymorpha TaxID=45954 RepID=A0A9D4KRR7_DREPO|nr:hypothetical protein DPMN_117446 [Dreissena polymorpha]